jgi:hypothetical protein
MNLRAGVFLFVSLLFLLGGSSLFAQEQAGKVLFVQGEAQVVRGGNILPLRTNDPIYTGDRIRTTNGVVKIILEDNSLLTLDRSSELVINEYLFQPSEKKRSGVFNMLRGKLKALMGRILNIQGSVEIRTPAAVAGVRGTYFLVEVQEDGNSNFVLFEGEITVVDPKGRSLLLTPGQLLTASPEGLGVPQPLPPQTLDRLEKEMEGGIIATFAQKGSAQESEQASRARAIVAEYRSRTGRKEEGTREGQRGEGDQSREEIAPPPPPPPSPIPPVNLQSVDPFRQKQVKVKIVFPELP